MCINSRCYGILEGSSSSLFSACGRDATSGTGLFLLVNLQEQSKVHYRHHLQRVQIYMWSILSYEILRFMPLNLFWWKMAIVIDELSNQNMMKALVICQYQRIW